MRSSEIFGEASRNRFDWLVYEDDFTTEGASNVPDTFKWDVIKDSSAAVTIEADQQNGVALLSSATTTNDDGCLVQSLNEFVKPTAGKRFAFECRIKSADADQMDVFVGLAQRAATNPENTLAASNRIGFQINDESASILCKMEKADLETSVDSQVDAANDTYVTLGFAYDGGESIEFEVDGNSVAVIRENLPATELAIALFQLSGNNTGTHTLRCDYVRCAVER